MTRIKFNVNNEEDVENIKEAWKLRTEDKGNATLHVYGYLNGRYQNLNTNDIDMIIELCKDGNGYYRGYASQNKYRLWNYISTYYTKAAYMRRKREWMESLENVVPTNDD